MRPSFRTDLTCSREEQQGVVFYRIDDPKAQTSFRLYEIEYLIAQKLDGQREIAEVIQAVKADHNFDISEADLRKFIGQLESMGFLAEDAGRKAGGAGDGDSEPTLIMRDRGEAAAAPAGGADLLDETPIAGFDEAELRRLLKSAFLHVRQGYIVHARDYFLAAKELNPSDSRVAKLVSHLEIMGDASGPAEVEQLWNQACELFPEIAEDVGPLVDANGGSDDKVAVAAARTSQAWDADLKARLMWLGLFVVLVVGGAAGLYYFAKTARVFEGAAKAVVNVVRAKRVPIYHASAAESVKAARESWLSFANAGQVIELKVTAGQRVAADQILAALELPPPVKKQLDAAQAALKKAEGEYDKVAAKLAKTLEEREAVEAERSAADGRLDELKPKNLLTQGGASKRDLEKWKRVKAKANKKLSQLAKKERGPRGAEAKAKKKLEQARKKVEAMEARLAQKFIRAPFAGVIVEIKVAAGASVASSQPIMLLRDPLEARLTFVVKDKELGPLAPGGEAFVAVARGTPGRAKVASVQPAGADKRVEVTIVDPAGSFVDMVPTEFRLVREFAEPAFDIPATAVFADERGHHVFVELQGRALLRNVEVLSSDAASVVVRDRTGALRDGDHLVVQRIGDGGVASIADGSFLETQN